MHMVIRAIVFAENKEDALSKAEDIFIGKCSDSRPFDYYAMFREGDGTSVSGSGRWGNLPAVVEASSKEGKKLIEEGMEYTEKEFEYNLEKVKELLSEDKVDDPMFRYHCHMLGTYEGSGLWLYDNDGEGIRDREHLENVLNKWNSKEYEDLKVFVVPADVHY